MTLHLNVYQGASAKCNRSANEYSQNKGSFLPFWCSSKDAFMYITLKYILK